MSFSIVIVNDWKYLFFKDAIGGRGSNFTFIHIGWLKTGIKDYHIDGFMFTVLGLGFRINNGS